MDLYYRTKMTFFTTIYYPIKSLLSASFTFSAKEKDTETGFSYFGSRYYSSGLSIWLSVDPMSDYYPDYSPYVFCGNNPIIYVDEIGTEFVDFSFCFYQDPPQKKDPEKPNTKENPYEIEEVVITAPKEQRTRRAQWVNIISAPVSFYYVEKVVTAIINASVIPTIFVSLATLMQGDTSPNQYSKSNGKNESHGDNGRALEKADKQIKDLEKQLKRTKNNRERKIIKKKIENIRKSAQKKKSGENHSNTNKR